MKEEEGVASTTLALAILEALRAGGPALGGSLAQASGSSEKTIRMLLSRLIRRGVPLRLTGSGWVLDGVTRELDLILWAAASALPVYEAVVLLEFVAGSSPRCAGEAFDVG